MEITLAAIGGQWMPPDSLCAPQEMGDGGCGKLSKHRPSPITATHQPSPLAIQSLVDLPISGPMQHSLTTARTNRSQPAVLPLCVQMEMSKLSLGCKRRGGGSEPLSMGSKSSVNGRCERQV